MLTKTLFAVLVVVFVGACTNDHDEEHHDHDIKVMVTSPLRTDTSVTREYVCQIRAIQHIELRALERGYLQRIYVDEGQTVRAGQLMFQLQPAVYEAEYGKAQAEARLAEIEYRNTRALADSNVVSKNELAMAQARLERAEAERSLAKARLQFTRIQAPFTGIMDRLQVRVGSLLEEGDILASLSDNSSMWVYFNVPEAQYLNLRSKNPNEAPIPVRLRMANNEIFPIEGRVTTIEADFNNETGNIAFRATFPNPKGLLRHGETGSVLLTENLGNVLLIPQKATFEVLDRKYVYVVDAKGHVHARAITIGAELPHLYVVSSGIQESDRIVIEGLRKIRENDHIETTFVQPREAVRNLGLYAE
jgi:membrane fusion protein (multidrug efflux system)